MIQKTFDFNNAAEIRKEMGRICIDHDHKTGLVRGLLCRFCNMAIGLLKDDSMRVLSAFEYLEKHKRG